MVEDLPESVLSCVADRFCSQRAPTQDTRFYVGFRVWRTIETYMPVSTIRSSRTKALLCVWDLDQRKVVVAYLSNLFLVHQAADSQLSHDRLWLHARRTDKRIAMPKNRCRPCDPSSQENSILRGRFQNFTVRRKLQTTKAPPKTTRATPKRISTVLRSAFRVRERA